jgi:hypothetical protein
MNAPFHQTPQAGKSAFQITGSQGAHGGGWGGGGAQAGTTSSIRALCPGGG